MKKIKILMVFFVFLFIMSFFAADIGKKQLMYEYQQETGKPFIVGLPEDLQGDAAELANSQYYKQYMNDMKNPMAIMDNVMDAFGPNGYLNQDWDFN